MGKENWVFIVKHPVDALKAIVLRAETKVFGDIAPTNYTGISLTDAIEGIQQDRKPKPKVSETIQPSDWPGSVQDDIRQGRVIHPDGRHPEHHNT